MNLLESQEHKALSLAMPSPLVLCSGELLPGIAQAFPSLLSLVPCPSRCPCTQLKGHCIVRPGTGGASMKPWGSSTRKIAEAGPRARLCRALLGRVAACNGAASSPVSCSSQPPTALDLSRNRRGAQTECRGLSLERECENPREALQATFPSL